MIDLLKKYYSINVDYEIPDFVKYITTTLVDKKYAVYYVGDCVREYLLGRIPCNWNLYTNAPVNELDDCFGSKSKYNTVIYSDDGEVIECTPVNMPNCNIKINLCKELGRLVVDLSFKDFTINAIAAGPDGSIYDPMNGLSDLYNKIIRCNTNPVQLFKADPLRILRAIKLAAIYNFSIEKNTHDAMFRCSNSLEFVPPDEIYTELCNILLTNNASKLLCEYSEIIAKIIPEFEPCLDFDQNNPHHDKNVYEHMMYSVDKYEGDDLIIKLALFLHDIAKPQCYTKDNNNVGHFYKHNIIGKQMAMEILQRFNCPNVLAKQVGKLIQYHDIDITSQYKSEYRSISTINRLVNKIGLNIFEKLLEVQRADALAQVDEFCIKKLKVLSNVHKIFENMKMKSFHIKNGISLSMVMTY